MRACLPVFALAALVAGCESRPPQTGAPGAGPRVHHILLEVADLDRSIAFYRDRFGFRLRSNSGGFAQLDGANLGVYLWDRRWDWEAPRRKGERQGLGIYPHLEVVDVKAMAERLKKAGCTIVQEPREYNTFTEAFVADPDGYTWALIRMASD